jgi:hypothetical protein
MSQLGQKAKYPPLWAISAMTPTPDVIRRHRQGCAAVTSAADRDQCAEVAGMPHAAHDEAALGLPLGEKHAGGFGAPLPVGATRPFGGHRFTRNGFGDHRDDLIACQRPIFNQRRRDGSNADVVLGDQSGCFRATEVLDRKISGGACLNHEPCVVAGGPPLGSGD